MSRNFGVVCYKVFDNRNHWNMLVYTNVFLKRGLAMFKYVRKT